MGGLSCKLFEGGQLGPGQLGPGAHLSGAQLSTFWGPNCPGGPDLVPTVTDWSNWVEFDDYPDTCEPPLFSSEWAHCTKEALVDMPALLAVPLPITCTDIVNIVVITNSVNSVIIVKCLTFIIKNVNNLESKATILSAKRKVDPPLSGPGCCKLAC